MACACSSATVKIAKEYERGIVSRLGRLIALKGPGLFFIFPFGIDHLRKVDLREVTLEVPQQEVITSDNVTVKVNAVISSRSATLKQPSSASQTSWRPLRRLPKRRFEPCRGKSRHAEVVEVARRQGDVDVQA